MKYRVDDIGFSRLDAAVALALGAQLCSLPDLWQALCRDVGHLTKLPAKACSENDPFYGPSHEYDEKFEPSYRMDHGWPIIDEYGISLVRIGDVWHAGQVVEAGGSGVSFIGPMASDEKPLIAAMRAFVKSKLGDEVELP